MINKCKVCGKSHLGVTHINVSNNWDNMLCRYKASTDEKDKKSIFSACCYDTSHDGYRELGLRTTAEWEYNDLIDCLQIYLDNNAPELEEEIMGQMDFYRNQAIQYEMAAEFIFEEFKKNFAPLQHSGYNMIFRLVRCKILNYLIHKH